MNSFSYSVVGVLILQVIPNVGINKTLHCRNIKKLTNDSMHIAHIVNNMSLILVTKCTYVHS